MLSPIEIGAITSMHLTPDNNTLVIAGSTGGFSPSAAVFLLDLSTNTVRTVTEPEQRTRVRFSIRNEGNATGGGEDYRLVVFAIIDPADPAAPQPGASDVQKVAEVVKVIRLNHGQQQIVSLNIVPSSGMIAGNYHLQLEGIGLFDSSLDPIRPATA